MKLTLTQLGDAVVKAEAALKENDSKVKAVMRRLDSLVDRNPYAGHRYRQTLIERVGEALADSMVGTQLKNLLSRAKADYDDLMRLQMGLIKQVDAARAALKTELNAQAPIAHEKLSTAYENLLTSAIKAIRPFCAGEQDVCEKAKWLAVVVDARRQCDELTRISGGDNLVAQAQIIERTLTRNA